MPIDLSWIGRELGPSEVTWTPDQCKSAFFETRNRHGESLIERGVFEFAKSQG
jgi:hypothetical protein